MTIDPSFMARCMLPLVETWMLFLTFFEWQRLLHLIDCLRLSSHASEMLDNNSLIIWVPAHPIWLSFACYEACKDMGLEVTEVTILVSDVVFVDCPFLFGLIRLKTWWWFVSFFSTAVKFPFLLCDWQVHIFFFLPFILLTPIFIMISWILTTAGLSSFIKSMITKSIVWLGDTIWVLIIAKQLLIMKTGQNWSVFGLA